MSSIAVKFTVKELEVLCSLATDQLFRREFIDKGFPGYKLDAGDLGIGKHVVERLRSSANQLKGVRPANGAAVARSA